MNIQKINHFHVYIGTEKHQLNIVSKTWNDAEQTNSFTGSPLPGGTEYFVEFNNGEKTESLKLELDIFRSLAEKAINAWESFFKVTADKHPTTGSKIQ